MRHRRRLLAVVMMFAAALACRRHEEQAVTIAASPAFVATGLPQQLARSFTAETHVKVEVQTIAAAPAVPQPDSKTADVALVEAAGLPAVLRSAGPERLVTPFAFDDFLLVGPRRDRARVARTATAAAAFRTILKRRQAFCSPVDVPRLHARELQIWAAAGVNPTKEPRYRPCKGDAVAVLDTAADRSAYTITDRATFESNEHKGLIVVLEKTPMLHNDYTAVCLATRDTNPNGVWFYQWLMSYRGREVVESYRFPQGQRFYFFESR